MAENAVKQISVPFVGGHADALERVRPILELGSQKIVHVGTKD